MSSMVRLRLKKLEDLPLDVVGETIGLVSVANYVADYEAAVRRRKRT